jgi:hypothetical protein
MENMPRLKAERDCVGTPKPRSVPGNMGRCLNWILILGMLAACSQNDMLQKFASPAEQAIARKYIDELRSLDFGDIGVISINKARVAGIDRALTKTGNDRRVGLCARALIVLKRQLRLRTRLMVAGNIDHDHVFFQETGESIRNLQFPQVRWRRTLRSLKLRYRRPYVARHSSVSWNLMIGKNLLWVSKQHGHSIDTMLRVYATWIEGTSDCDVAAIKRGMARRPPHLTQFAELSRSSVGTRAPTAAIAGVHAGRPGNVESLGRPKILAACLAAPSGAAS